MSARTDYIIVGGGSSGCMLAAGLARDSDAQVLLLEAGGSEHENPETLEAIGYHIAFASDTLMWERFTVPQQNLGGRQVFVGSGRTIGGGGAVNGMVYFRSTPHCHAGWPEGWRFSDIEGDYAAVEPSLGITNWDDSDFARAYLAAAQHAGFELSDDYPGGDLAGRVARQKLNKVGMERRSSYTAFVKPLLDGGSRNLRVRTGARVRRIIVEDGAARGVELLDGERLMAEREVILSAGALESPKLLMLSGIGPADELRAHGIPVLVDLDGVGKNMQDHLGVLMWFRANRVIDQTHTQPYAFARINPDSDLPAGAADTYFVAYPANSSMREGMMRMLPRQLLSDRLYALGWPRKALRNTLGWLFHTPPIRNFVAKLYGIITVLARPQSRGVVRLASANVADPLLVDPRYLSHPDDEKTLLAGLERAVEIAQAPTLAEGWASSLMMPKAKAIGDREALRAHVNKLPLSIYHHCCTCRMGEADDDSAVVDPSCRVRGVRGLRVVDASIFRNMTTSTPNALCMVVGHHAASIIRQSSVGSAAA